MEPNHEQAYQWETTVHNHIEFTNGSIIGTLLPLVGLVAWLVWMVGFKGLKGMRFACMCLVLAWLWVMCS